jgi:hypothetical protein
MVFVDFGSYDAHHLNLMPVTIQLFDQRVLAEIFGHPSCSLWEQTAALCWSWLIALIRVMIDLISYSGN